MLALPQWNRRDVLGAAIAASAATMFSGAASFAKEEEEEVSPPEDLMREHGVLRRVLLIYADVVRRIDTGQQPPAAPVAEAAQIVRTFVEDYHERNEETYVFPRFRKANKLVDLVDVLQAQHQAGRALTDIVIGLATTDGALQVPTNRQRLGDTLRQFSRMYAPHAAREDTVLFPALAQVVSRHEYGEWGEQFEKDEHRLFGEGGFDKMVERVATIERTLGIYDLSQFTPQPAPAKV